MKHPLLSSVFAALFTAGLATAACTQQADTAPDEPAQMEPTAQNAPVDVPVSALARFEGVYAGTYVCSLGENGITVSIDRVTATADPATANVDARLWFYDTASNPGHPSGAFLLSGTVTEGDMGADLSLTPGEWLSAIPENWGSAGIEGTILEDNDQRVLGGRPSGPGTSACEDMTLTHLRDF